MEAEGARIERLGLLLDQFDQAREMAQVRLTGLSDEEYLWEPVAGLLVDLASGRGATPETRVAARVVHGPASDRIRCSATYGP